MSAILEMCARLFLCVGSVKTDNVLLHVSGVGPLLLIGLFAVGGGGDTLCFRLWVFLHCAKDRIRGCESLSSV